MLRTKFHTVPNAFHKYLVPSANKDTKSEDQVISTFINLALAKAPLSYMKFQ